MLNPFETQLEHDSHRIKPPMDPAELVRYYGGKDQPAQSWKQRLLVRIGSRLVDLGAWLITRSTPHPVTPVQEHW